MLRARRPSLTHAGFLTLTAALLASLAACNGQLVSDGSLVASDGGAGATGATHPGQSLGSLIVQAEVPPGVPASTLSYVLDGPTGFTDTSTVAFIGSAVVQFVIANVPVGPGYTLQVITSSSDGTATCTGFAAPVTVLEGQATVVVLNLQCTGSANLDAPQPPATGTGTGTAPPPPTQSSLPDAAASDAPPPPPQLGSLDASATLPAGLSFSTALCELTGPSGLDFRDTLTLTSNAMQFAIQNIPAGTGDSLNLTATSTDGSETCRAMTTFDILPHQPTSTTLFFTCSAAARDQ